MRKARSRLCWVWRLIYPPFTTDSLTLYYPKKTASRVRKAGRRKRWVMRSAGLLVVSS